MSNKFDKPLGEWVEEEKEMPVFEAVLNKKGEVVGLKEGSRKVKQKMLYSQVGQPEKVSCKPNHHDYYIPDPHVHVAHCRNCSKRKFIRAIFEQVKDGKILNRDTQHQID